MWTFLLYLDFDFYWPVHWWELSPIQLTMGLNPYHNHFCLERASQCGLVPMSGHVQKAQLTLLSHIEAPLPLSQINRISLVRMGFFQSHIILMEREKEGKSPETKQ